MQRPPDRIVHHPSSPVQAQAPAPTASPPPGPIVRQPSPASPQSSAPPLRLAAGLVGATRYLCAAAHFDSGFQDQLVNHLSDKHHAIGRCFGVDMEEVTKYAIAARQRRRRRDVTLMLLLVAALLGLVPALAFGMSDWVVAYWLACAAGAVAAVLWAKMTAHGIAVNHLTKGRFRPGLLKPSYSSEETELLARARRTDTGNVVVYSGYSPFVGSGVELANWSFAIDVTKPKVAGGDGARPRSFDVDELYQHIAERIQALGLDNVRVEERLYVNGAEIREDRRFLPDRMQRPATEVAPAVLREFVKSPTESIRHYQCTTVAYWQGELVLSIFLRFVRVSRNLFAECSYFVLPPLRPEYHRIDSLTTTTDAERYAEMALSALGQTVGLWLASPFAAMSWWLEGSSRRSLDERVRRMIDQDNDFDFGCVASLREVAQASHYRQYFQVLDNSMYRKLLERQLLDGIVAFLDDRDIDTSDIIDRQNAILNSGVLVMGRVEAGGDVNLGQNIAAGNFSRIVSSPGEAGKPHLPAPK